MIQVPHYEIVDDGTDRDRWLRRRQRYCGASDAAAILNLSPYSTPHDVWLAKTEGVDLGETRFTTWGNRLEAIVAEWAFADYPDILGEQFPSPGLAVSTDYPMIAATVDRLAMTPDGTPAVVEIKTGSEYTKGSWFEENTAAPIAPLQYEVQVQLQTWVLDFPVGFIAPLIGGNDLLTPRMITPNPTFLDMALDTIAEWWERHIVGGAEPPVTARDDLQHLWRGTPGLQVTADARLVELVTERNELQPRIAADKKRDDAIKDEIRVFMGEATELVHPITGDVLVTWKRAADGERFDATAFALAHPALYEEFMTTKPGSRSMSFRKPKEAPNV